MDATQKTLLRNEIKLQLSKAKITIDNLKQIKKDERDHFIEIKLLEINDACLKWALQKQVISEDELKTNKFFTDNSKFSEYILAGGLASVGAISATMAYGATVAISTVSTTVAGTGIAGFFGSSTLASLGLGSIAATTTATVSVITTTTIAATAAPIALAGAGIYGVIKYKENKEIEKLIKHFENEKSKILSFYLDKIERIELIENKDGKY